MASTKVENIGRLTTHCNSTHAEHCLTIDTSSSCIIYTQNELKTITALTPACSAPVQFRVHQISLAAVCSTAFTAEMVCPNDTPLLSSNFREALPTKVPEIIVTYFHPGSLSINLLTIWARQAAHRPRSLLLRKLQYISLRPTLYINMQRFYNFLKLKIHVKIVWHCACLYDAEFLTNFIRRI